MSKKLILARHGAYDEVPKNNNDTTALSEEGIAQVEAAAQAIIENGLIPDVIFHSPITRTTQTAYQLKAAFDKVTGGDIEIFKTITLYCGNTDLKRLRGLLSDKYNTVMNVTHQPNIDHMSRQITTHHLFPDTAEVNVFDMPGDKWAEMSSGVHALTLNKRRAS